MGRRKGSIITAVALTAGSAAAAVLIRKRSERKRPHVGMYFEDGSMISLPDSSPQAGPLIELGRDIVRSVKVGK
jgi:hypothetical protein